MKELLATATPAQARYIEAWIKHGSAAKAAKALGVAKGAVINSVGRARRRAARIDPAQHIDQAPAGYAYKGVSTLVRADGTPVLQWRKTAREAFDPDALREALLEAVDSLPRARRIAAPKRIVEGTLNLLPVGDPHYGMLSWPSETGQQWDLKIAAEVHDRAIGRLFAKAPVAAETWIVYMGDNSHADDDTAQTPRGKHNLDTDSRWERVLGVLFTGMCNAVNIGLQRSQKVVVRIVKGNHDPRTAAGLALALEARYHNEPRVEVDRSPRTLWVRTWDRVLLAFAHGHEPTPDRVPDILAADYREEIGRTEQGYLYTGHKHSKILQERGGLVMEAVQTLAARDSYAANHGWRSARGLFLDTYQAGFLGATDRACVAAQDVERG